MDAVVDFVNKIGDIGGIIGLGWAPLLVLF